MTISSANPSSNCTLVYQCKSRHYDRYASSFCGTNPISYYLMIGIIFLISVFSTVSRHVYEFSYSIVNVCNYNKHYVQLSTGLILSDLSYILLMISVSS